MRKSFLGLTIVCMLLTCTLNAQQKLSIENVYKAKLQNSGAIVSNNEVKGYFLFYQTDKVDRKNYEYTLQILDENLNKVKDISFTDSKTVELQEACYNGSHIMFEFYDKENKYIEFKSYDVSGKEIVSYRKELSKKTIRYIERLKSQADNDDVQNKTLFPVENLGFISCIPLKEDGDFTFEVNYYNGAKKAEWAFSPTMDYKYEVAQFLGNSDSVAVFQVTRKKALLAGKQESWMAGVDIFTGKKIFDYQTENKDKFNFLPLNVATIKGQNGFVLSGPYYNPDDNVMKDKSLGIGIWVMTNKGDIVKSKYDSWEKDLSKFLSVNSKGKVDDIGYLYIHNVVRTSDDKIFAIAEGYKQQASALGIASKILSKGSVSAIKLKITDLVLLEFDKNYDLKKATVYDKSNNNLELPGGAEGMGPQTMALMAKYYYDAFDYAYTQVSKDGSSFVVGYNDYVKEDGYKGGTFNTLTYYGGKITTDKINLKSDATSVKVLPGKTGSVVLLEYFRKGKKLEIRIEKMN